MRMTLFFAGLLLASFVGAAQAGQVLNRQNDAEPESLDPQKTTSLYPIGIVRDLYIGLITLSNDGQAIPGVAESWDISPDGKSWTFHLRHDSKWSNGDPVTADDFVYSFRRLVDPKTAAADPSDLTQLVNYAAIQSGKETDLTKLGVDAPDPYTLHLSLTEPRLILKYFLTDAPLFPLHRATVEKWGNEWTRPEHAVTNGPYLMKSWVPQDQIVLVKNPAFFDADSIKIDEVHWVNTADRDAAFKRYRAGELDWIDLTRTTLPLAKQTVADQIHQAPTNSYSFMNINMKKGPLAGDIRLREALNLAIDRELYATKIDPRGQQPAYSVNPPIISNYTTQPMPMKDVPQSERIARAKELVAAAGYSPDKPLKLTVSYPTDENTKQILLSFRQMLLPTGIELTLNNMEWQVFVGLVNARNFDIGILQAAGTYDDYENGLDNYRSDANEANYSAYSNPVFDDLFHRGSTATDINVRRDLMQQAERTMLADFPLVPVSFGVINRVVNPQLVGVLDGTRVPQSRYLSFRNASASQ